MLGFSGPWARLCRQGIMGLNQRNADFILPYNSRRNYPQVDDKCRTKHLAIAAGIPVPRFYGVIEIVHQIGQIHDMLKPCDEFVVKPAHGTRGEGVLIITGRCGDRYRKTNGSLIARDELGHHAANILSGMYSLGGLPDSALIEYRVNSDPVFEPISFQGVPDIRTLVFRGVPVLSMIRLPTRWSEGKANLHQGALGVGIDLKTGRTSFGVWHENPIDQHPDTGGTLSGLEIPRWDEILSLAARCHDLVGLGFLGVDIVLDALHGPMMLELNARPGLGIQLANRTGLLPRLRAVEALKEIPASVQARVELAQSLAHGWA